MAAVAGTVVLGLSTTLSAIAIGAAVAAFSAVSSIAMSALADTPSLDTPSLSYDSRERTQMVKQAITAWRTIYGEVKVSGPVTFLHTTGSSNNKCHILLTIACHEVAAIGDVYFNDELIPIGDDHKATGRWAGYARVWKGLGTVAGDADLQAALEANCPGVWTSEHRQYGRAKLYIEFTHSATLLASGLPTVTVVVKGKPVYEPRTGKAAWSANPILCLRDYLTLPAEKGGVGALAAEIDADEASASASVCDELVACVNSRRVAASVGTAIGSMTGGDGLDAAFDGTASTTSTYSASGSVPATIGKQWTEAKTIGRLQVFSPSDTGWVSGSTGSVTLALRGSNDGVAWTVLATTTGFDTETQQSSWEPDPDDIDTSKAYLRHGILITATDGGTAYVSELRFYERIGTEVRYALNGTIDHDKQPKEVLPRLLSACAGTLVQTGGVWRILAGYYRTPTVELTDDDITGSIKLSVRQSRADSFNAVKATYTSPDNDWVTTDAPPYRNGTYEVEDGGDFEAVTFDPAAGTLTSAATVAVGGALRLWTTGILPAPLKTDTTYYAIPQATAGVIKLALTRAGAEDGAAITLTSAGTGTHRARFGVVVWSDTEAPYTTSPSMVQRLERVKLEQMRQGMTVELPCTLRALRLRAGDTAMVTRPRFGWVRKPFVVTDWSFTATNDNDGLPVLGISLALRETAPAVFDWSDGEETVVDLAPNTALPPAWDVPPPTDLSLASGTDHLLLMGDGTVVSRLLVTWSGPAGTADHIEVQWRAIAAPEWQVAPSVPLGATSTLLTPVRDGVSYLVRLRSVSVLGAVSQWITSSPHVVVGKTAAPAVPPYLSASINGTVVVFRWAASGEADYGGAIIRYGLKGAAWGAKTTLTEATRGTQITTAAVPPGDWEFELRYVDTSGNVSPDGATAAMEVGSAQTVVSSVPQGPDWLGLSSGWVRHWTGVLVPDSTKLAVDMTDEELWDVCVSSPVPLSTYTMLGEVSLPVDGAPRLWAGVTAALGPGETVGSPSPLLEVATRTLAGKYSAWTPWTIGTTPCGAYKMRVSVASSDGAVLLTQFVPTADASLQSEDHPAVPVSADGAALIFGAPFLAVPNIQVTPTGAAAQIGTSDEITVSGATIHLFAPTGAPMAGAANVTITGPR
jgi:hypothetical protein